MVHTSIFSFRLSKFVVAPAILLALSCQILPATAAASPRAGTVHKSANPAFDAANSLAGHAQYKQAVEKYQVAIAAQPKNPAVVHMYGRTLALMGQLQDAIVQYRKALELSKSPNAELENDIGVALAANDETPEAARHLKKAITLNPKFIAAYNNLGVALSHLGDYKAAHDMFTVSLKMQPTNKYVDAKLKEVNAKLGESKHFDYNVVQAVAKPATDVTPEVSGAASQPTTSPAAATSVPPVSGTTAPTAKAPDAVPVVTTKTTSATTPPKSVSTKTVVTTRPSAKAAASASTAKAVTPADAAPPVAVAKPAGASGRTGPVDPALLDLTTSLKSTGAAMTTSPAGTKATTSSTATTTNPVPVTTTTAVPVTTTTAVPATTTTAVPATTTTAVPATTTTAVPANTTTAVPATTTTAVPATTTTTSVPAATTTTAVPATTTTTSVPAATTTTAAPAATTTTTTVPINAVPTNSLPVPPGSTVPAAGSTGGTPDEVFETESSRPAPGDGASMKVPPADTDKE